MSTTDIAEMAGVNRFDVRRPLKRSGIQPVEVRGGTALFRREDAGPFARKLRAALEQNAKARAARERAQQGQ